MTYAGDLGHPFLWTSSVVPERTSKSRGNNSRSTVSRIRSIS